MVRNQDVEPDQSQADLFDPSKIETTPLEDMLTYLIDSLKEEISTITQWLDMSNEMNPHVEEIIRLLNAAEDLQQHFEFTIELMNTKADEEVPALKEKFRFIKDRYPTVHSKHDLTQLPVKYAVVIMYEKMFLEFKKTTTKCFTKSANGEIGLIKSAETMAWIKIVIGRFKVADKHYGMIFVFPKDDIFAQEKTSEVWQDLHQIATFKQIITKQEVRASFKQLHLVVRIGYIILEKFVASKENPSFGLALSVLQDILYYGIRQNKAETQALFQLINPKIEEAFLVWNLVDHPLVSKALDLRVPIVGNDDKIFIPRLFPRITKDLVMKEYRENTFNKLQPMDPESLVAPELNGDRRKILEDLFTEDPDKISIRILASDALNLRGDDPGFLSRMVNKGTKVITGNADNDHSAIVIHIHGGGFVSMSSQSHKMYLNRWVKDLKLVHFSIDYRVAPQNMYPEALDDVWQAYLWIINYAELVLGIKNQKVIIAGDSAGGNLAVALILRLVRAGIQPPHGCFLIYPCLAVDINNSSPSYFLSLDDPLLPYSLLKLVTVAYTGSEFKNLEDPFISPIRASYELLEKMPPIRIVAGSEDPLYDDNWRFIAKLRKLRKDVKIIVHEHLSHAFLCHQDLKNYDVFIKEACDQIRELISLEH